MPNIGKMREITSKRKYTIALIILFLLTGVFTQINTQVGGLFVGLFGVKTTIIYVVSGILLGTISGVILQKLKLAPIF